MNGGDNVVTANDGRKISEEIAVLLKDATDDQKRQIKCILIGAKLCENLESHKSTKKN